MVTEAVNDHLRILQGLHPMEVESGSIGYFLDRKAAVFGYRSRLHAISLLVFRAEGLPWPDATDAVGKTGAYSGARSGFNVILWRSGETGYALVSEVDPSALRRLAAKISGGA